MRPRGGGQTPYQYSRRTKALLRAAFRRAIDDANPDGVIGTDQETALMVAEDAKLVGRSTAVVETLAQIPPVKIGRYRYRVIGERIVDEGLPGEHREIALVCRSQDSCLFEHTSVCECRDCEAVTQLGNTAPCWQHDRTNSKFMRNADGTFTQILPLPRGGRFVVRTSRGDE